MSNMIGRATEYRIKAGSRATLQLTITDSAGTAKNLSDTGTYTSGLWKVWKPSGTLIINGAIVFDDRTNGIISYALSATDTAITNAGNWEGEVELKNSSGVMVEQTQSFNFTIEESY